MIEINETDRETMKLLLDDYLDLTIELIDISDSEDFGHLILLNQREQLVNMIVKLTQ